MIKEEDVKEALYKKYIEPTKHKKGKYIGIEIEMPIINLAKAPVEFENVHKVTEAFIDKFNFDEINCDDEGNIYNAGDSKTGDILSYDCSYNNLELSLGKGNNINELNERFKKYYSFLYSECEKYGYVLTGMGVNPYRIYNHNVPIPNGRYRMLFHHLESYEKYKDLPMVFHKYPSYGTFSSASQVQLDVTYDNVIETIDVFSKLEPIKALIFSNSVLLNEHEEILCCRDMFWENSTHGINPHNIGMFEKTPDSIEELQAYIESTSIYCVERDEKYINFSPINIIEYFKQESITGEYFDGEKYENIEVIPRLSDIDYLRTFKFEDLTFRGTVEFRSVCCQPISDSMTVAAFHVGLMENQKELKKLLDDDKIIYGHGYHVSELRKLFTMEKLPDFLDVDAAYELAEQVIDLASDGLKRRGYGEERYLKPLYKRTRNKTNPARTMLDRLKKNDNIEKVVLDYGRLEMDA
jgi:gamma-glutamylcysteine synthetase